MICSACGNEIEEGSQTAISPSGEIHYRCFSLMTLHKEIGDLERRVQVLEQLERTQAHHAANIPFRIGSNR